MFELAAAALPLALTDFSDMKNVVIGIVGNVILIILVVRGAADYGKRDWGGLITNLIFGVIVGFFVWFNDQAVALLKHLGTLIFGG